MNSRQVHVVAKERADERKGRGGAPFGQVRHAVSSGGAPWLIRDRPLC